MTLAEIEAQATAAGLIVMGGFHPGPDETLILLGTGPGFWPVFTAAPEYRDGAPDPVDRWSKRILGGMATTAGGTCSFPSDGPPYAPFIGWALQTGRFHQSPVGMMVHDVAGLMISLRGALHLPRRLDLPPAAGGSPCDGCPAPCTTACPVGALTAGAPYDVATCHDWLDGPGAESCMVTGCAARLACPLSAGAGREPAQSALHMRSFHRR